MQNINSKELNRRIELLEREQNFYKNAKINWASIKEEKIITKSEFFRQLSENSNQLVDK